MKLIDFSPRPLFKLCPLKYDITKGCNTLRIGTLWGFREEENELLRDAGEGEFDFKIRFPRLTPVSNEWISEFEFASGGSAHIGRMALNKDNISVEDVTLKGSANNCWIFCVSLSDSAAGNISEAHDSKWMVSGEKIQEFGNFLGALLWSKISIKDLPPDLVKKYTFKELSEGLALQMDMRAVDYTNREVLIEDERSYPVEKIRELKSSIPFIKPLKFLEEQEFRFAFWLMFRKQKITINDNPKILQLRQIDQFVSSIQAKTEPPFG
ncbi:hypothetical protein OS189_03515 [Sulfitobacter sp. F26169L]|uniref:hypothetical protein n=1 Tax=Sulfitobacter sp. F26169L TaxID=2996015 RepID=UPI002260A211|nr:hypothetical protein [Sulfitobacter sp. F26169L]MCX7565413.1 hypothetical protein [Sulfitobacter sp. F26169L]